MDTKTSDGLFDSVTSAEVAFDASDASLTIGYQDALLQRGAIGQVAFGLFRAQKRSAKAKKYRRSNRRNAYDSKNDAIKYVDAALTLSKDVDYIEGWGWQYDPATIGYENVLYVQTCFGQCSYHCAQKFSDKVFRWEWDTNSSSRQTVLRLCDAVVGAFEPRAFSDESLMPFGRDVGKQLKTIVDEQYASKLLAWQGIDAWKTLKSYLETKVDE